VGIGINAGHDLTHTNLPLLVREIDDLAEVSIGHHLITHALDVGLERSVKDYLAAAHA
jgi:pyridoxine 5-phosphate synthase